VADIYDSVDAFRASAYARAEDSLLAEHVNDTYGVKVVATQRLDGGVVRVDLEDGSAWVARVFPRLRPQSAAEGDADILELVRRHGFPAERCIPDPVSVLDGSAVLVTEFVRGRNCRGDRDPALLRRLGELLAVLHSLPVESSVARPAGSWHSLSIEGGDRRHDIDALLSLLADARRRVTGENLDALDQICRELDSLDTGDGLPRALTHPDFVGANVIRTDDGNAVLVDWTGAGVAPRVCSLGFLLASTGGHAKLVEAVVSGYQSGIRLTDEELARLPDAVRTFPLVLDCWAIVYRAAPPAAVAAKLPASRAYGATVADRTRRAALQ
jgi:Ser/Thr protein kinase RdoA (MazF antagonist)